MARKNLLDGLGVVDPGEGRPLPRRTGGAIGAVGKTFADMRANSIIEVPADMIDAAGLTDRLGEDGDHAALVASIRDHGQQVPVLLRHSPNTEGRYEVVYGRRRVAALKELRQPVRAMVRDLQDTALIVAQGQENTARKDLSFIEKANFARQMRDMGFERTVIQAALHQDETVISRMLKVADAIPERVIRAIGDAPKAGRDRWLSLARALEGREEAVLTAVKSTEGGSDARFEAALAATRDETPAKEPKTAVDKRPWGEIRRSARGTTFALDKDKADFAAWLVQRMDDLHDEWSADRDDPTPSSKEEEA